jgi:predicted GIY-YIG superfamily endonuclease
MIYYVYLLVSQKNSKSYVGFTGKHPEVRLKEHNDGSDPWTSANGPFKLVYYETFICKTDA